MPDKPTPIKIGRVNFDFSRPYIMGIVNVTPDSFSDGGKFYERRDAIDHALKLADEGADIVDIGGESTRPGADPVSEDDELKRVIPVIEALFDRIKVPISIDTCKPGVAAEAISAGASLINDISGFHSHPEMAELAAQKDIPAVVMHIKGTPRDMQKNPDYDDLIGEISEYFEESIAIAEKGGMKKENLILDPGIGFGKTFENNFTLIKRISEFKRFGLPLLVGASRKRFLSMGNKYVESERIEQSLAASCAAVMNGANMVRVHDVLATRKALWVISKIESSA